MKANRLGWFLFFLVGCAVVQPPTQQSKADRKLLEDDRAKAEKGDAQSQLSLGYRYANGRGVATNYVEAVKWYRKAAEQNLAEAQCALGFCYEHGQGVTNDETEALKWMLLAASQGDEDAKKGAGILESLMTGEQIAHSEKLARDFKPRERPPGWRR